MRNNWPLLARFVALVFVLSFVSPSHAQGVLIGPSIRNGSFEDGVLTPWGASEGTQVLHNTAFASDGSYYAALQTALVQPVLAVQNLTPSPNEGLRFLLSFDARIGTPGLNILTPAIGGRSPGGASLSASVSTISAPPLSTSAWQSYQYELQMPANWGSSGITFRISFSKAQPLGGITHFAYLDNVVLQQIPEPSSLGLLSCAGLLFLARRRCIHKQ